MSYTSVLIVETGQAGVDSNTYCTLSFVDSYHTLHGHTDWLATPDINDPSYNTIMAQKETALIEATQAIDLLYGQKYLGVPKATIPLPALLYPRFIQIINWIQVVQTGQIPVQLQKAVAEVALMYINGIDIFPMPKTDNLTSQTSVKVGELGISKSYFKAPFTERFNSFRKIDLLLKPLLRNNEAPTQMSM